MSIVYSVGDHVVYPCHGAGRITGIERREVLGRQREYLTVQMRHNRMTALIPVESAQRAGLRKVVSSQTVDQVLEVLRGEPREIRESWHARAKRHREKVRTGDVMEIAEVVRDLVARQAEKGLPLGGTQMLAKARTILVSELMYARDLTEDEVMELLADVMGSAVQGS